MALPSIDEVLKKNKTSSLPSIDEILGESEPVRSVQTSKPLNSNTKAELDEINRRLDKQNAGRDIPILGNILGGLDVVGENPVVEKIAEIGRALYVKGAGPANIKSAYNAAGAGLNRIAPKLGSTKAGRVAQEAIKEGVVGVPLAMGEAVNMGETDTKDILQQGALGGLLGAGTGAVTPLIGAGVRKALQKLLGRSEQPETIQEILSLPEPKQRGNINQAQTPEIIYGQGKVKPNEPLMLNAPELSPTTVRRGFKEQNTYAQKLQRLFDEANNLESQGKLTPGRELEEVESLWSRMAEPTDPGLDELINLASKPKAISPNALAKGRSAQAAGAGPNVNNTAYKGFVGEALAPQQRTGIRKATTEPTPLQDARREALGIEPKSEVLDDLIKTKEPRVRDKVYSYLDEAEKAARERLKGKRNTLSSNPIDQYADHAIILASRMGKGGIKLADATEYLVKEFGESIRPHAQSIYNKARRFVQETERRASKEAQEARTFNAKNQGNASTFRSKVNRETKSNKTPFSERWEKLRTQFIDDLAPLEGLEKRVRGKVASAEDSLYKSGRLFRGTPEKANRIVKDRLAPIVNGIEKQGYTSADLGDYALAVHARDVNAKDIKSGFTDKEINEVINRLGTPEMEAARKALIKISDDMLKELEKAGVISGELVSALKEKHPNYMPLFRNFDDDKVDFVGGLGKSLANVTSPIKGLKGSGRQVIDPLESMVKNIFQSTNAAERNKVASQLIKLAKEDADAQFIRKLDEGEEVGRKNVVSVLQDGEKVRYEVEPEVYKALLSLDKESSNMLIKVLQKPASLLRAGATLTPEFSLRNPLRDVLQAFVTSESGFNPLIDFPIGLIQSISKGDLYKKWADELGAYGNIISNDRQVHKEALTRVLKEKPGKKFVNVVTGKSAMNLLRAIADASESATKVGEFRAALRKGESPQEAAYRSRDVMDFGRAGISVRQTNRIVAFLNANIQGKSKLLRAFKADPAGFSARAFSAVTVPTIGVFLAQKYLANDKQKLIIKESPAWLTDSFWLIPVPNTDHVARIPKPFDLSILFSNLPERALKYVFNNDKEAFDKYAKKAMADMAIPGMISGLTPFIEGMANYSFFRGGNIIPVGEQYRNYEDQFDIDTTGTAKLFAKGAQAITGGEGMFKNFSSPRIMDNTIRGLTAGLGTYATSAIDIMLEGMNLTDKPVKPEKGVAQRPLARAFLVNPLQGGKSTNQLYEMRDKLTREKGSAKINNRPFKDNAKLNFINKRTGRMADINKLIRDTENSRTMSASEKRKRIESLLEDKNKIARDTMEAVK